MADLIDLEYQFELDQRQASRPADLHDRDRRLFKQYIQPQIQNRSLDDVPRKELICRWLEAVRKDQSGRGGELPSTPGNWYIYAYRRLGLILLIVGLLSGTSLAGALCQYEGQLPINVLVFLALAVFAQYGLLVLLFLIQISPREGLARDRAVVQRLFLFLLSVFMRACGWAAERGGRLKHVKALGSMETGRERLAKVQQASRVGLAVLQTRSSLYRRVWYWPIMVLTQWFALAFNVGVLAGFLFMVIGTDRAFAWESSYGLTPEMVFKGVDTLAKPWSGWVGHAHPTLEQVRASQFSRQAGLIGMPGAALKSWIHFLYLTVLFYGIVPRLLLLLAALSIQRWSIRSLEFNDGRCNSLINRMRRKMVAMNGVEPGTGIDYPTAPIKEATTAATRPSTGELSGRGMPADQAEYESCEVILWALDLQPEQVSRALGEHCRRRVTHVWHAGGKSYADDRAMVQSLVDRLPAVGEPVVIIAEAWDEPTQDFISFVRELRHAVGEKTDILIALIGEPEGDRWLTRVSDMDWKIWNDELQTIVDPYLRIEMLESA